jgi:hypothetical protein
LLLEHEELVGALVLLVHPGENFRRKPEDTTQKTTENAASE